MRTIKEGDKVQILCEAKLENGELCYTNDKDNLIEVIVGDGKFFPAIEKALQEMQEGESKTLILQPEEAFGPHLDDLVVEVPKTAFNPDVKLTVGSRIRIDAPTGKSFTGTIVNVKDETFTLDLNHYLAGKRLVVTITVVSIAEEITKQ
jgi:FKBP-type peptidyl-prolyl cis-trans isomerase 2